MSENIVVSIKIKTVLELEFWVEHHQNIKHLDVQIASNSYKLDPISSMRSSFAKLSTHFYDKSSKLPINSFLLAYISQNAFPSHTSNEP